MKRKLLLLGLLLTFIQTIAQSPSLYTQTTFTADYTNLEDITLINNENDWFSGGYAEVQIPFQFKIAGETMNFFTWTGFSFIFLSDSQESAYELLTDGLVVRERPSEIGVPQSSMAYKVEGEEGSRILKIEVKNAGLTAEPLVNSTTNIFLNYQIWIYEGTDVIEYRYGPSNITAEDMVTYDIFIAKSFFLTGIWGYDVYNCFVYGNLANPFFIELATDEEGFDSYRITTYPAEKTVYRFAPNGGTVSTEEFNKTQFSLYPNPVAETLTVSLKKTDVSDYIITDMTGKLIQKGSFNGLENMLQVKDLPTGMYFMTIGNTTKKFIKK